MNVLSIAYPMAPVGPNAVGGAEQVLSAIDRALVSSGHRSIVVARADSEIAGEKFPIPIFDRADAASRDAAQRATAAALTVAMPEADLVHMHGLDFLSYLPPPGKPVMVTLHLPASFYPAAALTPPRPDTWLNCVSWSQHRTFPASPHMLRPILNGVELPNLPPTSHATRGHTLTLGRICPEKGQHLAIEAARLARVPLLIGGAVFPYPDHCVYFDVEIRPRLDPMRRFLGPVGAARKRRLLSSARCLLVPSLVAETSSLVTMEALSCGTPVVAFDKGALPDLIEPGRTGFVVRDVAEMAAAIPACANINRNICIQAASERFSGNRMTASYLEAYARLLGS